MPPNGTKLRISRACDPATRRFRFVRKHSCENPEHGADKSSHASRANMNFCAHKNEAGEDLAGDKSAGDMGFTNRAYAASAEDSAALQN